MKLKRLLTILSASALLLIAAGARAESLVLLHTNDTHSQIEPDASGAGGVLQRKALIDSVRKAEKNVLLIDAGDMVQGSLFFKFFRGDVEYPLMNLMGYDIRILGNHEFDNGLEELAAHYKDVKAARLSANYDFSDTPLKGMFDPWTIRKVGGKKIGFIGINVDPSSLISKENTVGMKFRDIVETANATAEFLKKEKKCDLVVVVSHIGVVKDNDKATDYDLARASRDIDVIIGGHSHTVIKPGREGKYPSIVDNAEGRPVLVAQTGKYGRNLGYIKIDLDNLAGSDPSGFDYRLIPVTDRFPHEKFDRRIISFLEPFRHKVDSVNRRVIARSARTLRSDDRNGGFANLTADMAFDYALHKADSLRSVDAAFPQVDFSIMNVGGIRLDMPEGDVTEGQILTTYPFSNHLVIGSVKGSDVIDALRVAARKGGEAVSRNVRVAVDPEGNLTQVLLNGYPMDPEKYYTYATIDYVFAGNDDLVSLSNGRMLWRDDVEVAAPLLRYVERMGAEGIPLNPDPEGRFVTISR